MWKIYEHVPESMSVVVVNSDNHQVVRIFTPATYYTVEDREAGVIFHTPGDMNTCIAFTHDQLDQAVQVCAQLGGNVHA